MESSTRVGGDGSTDQQLQWLDGADKNSLAVERRCCLLYAGSSSLVSWSSAKWTGSEYAFLRRHRVVAQPPPESSRGCKCRGAKPMIVYGVRDRWRPLEAAPRGVNNAPLDLV